LAAKSTFANGFALFANLKTFDSLSGPRQGLNRVDRKGGGAWAARRGGLAISTIGF